MRTCRSRGLYNVPSISNATACMSPMFAVSNPHLFTQAYRKIRRLTIAKAQTADIKKQSEKHDPKIFSAYRETESNISLLFPQLFQSAHFINY